MNVLIVDDQLNLARITAVALRLLGCQTFIAHSIENASQQLDAEKIDAIFLDVNLAGESGMEYLSQLKTRSAEPPVVMFTAQNKDEVSEEALRRGAFDCLTKPFTLDDLRLQLGRIAEHRPAVSDHPSSKVDPAG